MKNNLGSNNPFQHERVVKPGSKAVVVTQKKSGAMTHRVHAKEERTLAFASQLQQSRQETKKNYVVLKNPRQSIAQPQARVTPANMPVRAAQRETRGNDGSPLTPRGARVDQPADGI